MGFTMKKIVIIAILSIFLLMPLAGALSTAHHQKTIQPNQIISEDFTHAVFAEYVTTTTCPYCPPASNQLYSIYNSGDYDFYYVSLVADASPRILKRVGELNVVGVPDVFFDGGYKNIGGAQNNEQPYRTAIQQCGQRPVPDIDIDVSVEWRGGVTLKISVTVNNNEPEEYKGHLRVYVAEKQSRWNDNNGNPYHYAALAIPIDSSLAVPKANVRPLGDSYTFTKTWFGGLLGYGDITQDNIVVIASVFDKQTDYVVQSEMSEITSVSPSFAFVHQFNFFKVLQQRYLVSRIINLL
jgi:glutaredoxin